MPNLNADQIKLGLLRAAQRLQAQVTSSRGTVMDDDKVPGLESEIAALMAAHEIIHEFTSDLQLRQRRREWKSG